MGEARPPAHTVGSITAQLGGRLVGPSELVVSHLESLDKAGPGALSFIRSRDFAERWAGCVAPAALVSEGIDVPGHDPSTRALIYVKDADLAMVTLLGVFMPAELSLRRPPGVHPSAVIDLSARVSPLAHVGPHCVIEHGAEIADGVTLVANCFIGSGVKIAKGTTLHAGVAVLTRCTIGRACILWPNVSIGADGFGYRPAPPDQLAATGGLVKIPHVGSVEIGDLVEIGANTSIDRGKFGATTIGAGTKIDNHVQIGHNVRIGRACVICGCSGVGGSVVIEDGVIIGGHVGIKDGIRIGAGAMIVAKSGVMQDVPPAERWMGFPARPLREFAAIEGILGRIARAPGIIKALFRDRT